LQGPRREFAAVARHAVAGIARRDDQSANLRLASGLPRVVQAQGASVPRSRRSMSLKSAPDLSYDLPPAGERNRHLGNPIVTHRSTLIRYPAGTMTPPRQKNAAGVKTMGEAHLVAPRPQEWRAMRWPRSTCRRQPPNPGLTSGLPRVVRGILARAARGA
jgi:hypothetical protein